MVKYNGELGEISVESDLKIEWSIEDFFAYTEEDEYYYSPDFTLSGSEWYFQVYPNGCTLEHCVGWVSLYLGRYPNDSPPVGVSYTFGVKKVDGTVEQLLPEVTWVYGKDCTMYRRPHLLERSVLVQRKSELVPSDSLTIICTLTTRKYYESSRNLEALSRNLLDLFISKRISDATLMVKGKEFSVHKSILSARSPVLAAMFETDMKEKRTGIVEIEDCDPDAFKEFLAYLYTGKIEESSSNALELYKIADKYDVRDLTSYCRMTIMADLSVENVLDAVLLGRQFDEKYMNLITQKFFNKNFTKIIPSSKWATFLRKNADIANELLNGMVIGKVT